MARLALLLALVTAACTSGGAPGTMPPATPPPTPVATAAAPTTPPATTLPSGCRDRLTGGGTGVLAAFDLPSGSLRWQASIAVPDVPFQVPLTVAGDLVVVKEGDTLWALDAATCAVRWELPARHVLAVAAGGGDVAVVDSIALRLVDSATAEQRWSFGMRWEPPEPPAAVAFAPGLVVVTTPDDELVILDAATGDEVARAGFTEHLRAPLVAGERVYVNHGSTVEARYLADASGVWATDVGFTIFPDVAVAGDAVFVVSSDDATVAVLEAATGEERWRRTIDERRKFVATPIVDHDEVHLLDTAGGFHHLDVADGSTVFTSSRASDLTTTAPEAGLLLEQGGGRVTAFTMLERHAWELETGAGEDRLSVLELGAGFTVALTFDWEG